MYPVYPFQTQFMQQTTPAQNIQYVNGASAVEPLFLPPNSSAVYLDSDGKTFYTKQTDASGAATIKTYTYKEKEKEKPVEYVTRAEFETFKANMKGAKHEPNVNATHKGE